MRTPALYTARGIAEELGAPRHRVLYVLRTRRDAIPPVLEASQTRLYAPSVVPLVRAALHGIDARKGRFFAPEMTKEADA